jgi:hypothetical protein
MATVIMGRVTAITPMGAEATKDRLAPRSARSTRRGEGLLIQHRGSARKGLGAAPGTVGLASGARGPFASLVRTRARVRHASLPPSGSGFG